MIFLAAGALLAAVTFAVFDRTAGALAGRLATRWAAREALLQQSRVSALLEREVALALKLADDPVVRRWAAREDDPALEAAAMAQLESYRRGFRSGSFFVALEGSRSYRVYDASPRREAVRKATLREEAPGDRWYFEAIRRGEPYALNVDASTTLDAVKVWVNVLIRDERGATLGIGGTGIDLTDFLAGLRPREPGEPRTLLVDGRGVVQAHWDRAVVERNARARSDAEKATVYDLVPPGDAARLRAALAELGEGAGVRTATLRLDGRPYLAAATYMKGVGWYDLVLLDAEEVFSARNLLPLLLAMAVGVAALLGVLALTLDRWLVAPLAALTAAARGVAAGDYRARVPERRQDELGLLARAFNAMTAKVLEHTDRLEEKVADRTRRLAASNEALRASQERMEESLRYARAIQASILPPREVLEADLGPCAILHRPRDLVGGDFHHHARLEGGSLTLVVDCTGHGVPGAFVSMAASATLRHVLEGAPAGPAEVLARLNRGVRDTRHHSDVRGALDAGMDVLACRVDRRDRTLRIAGAGLAAFVLDRGEVRVLEGDRQRVGYGGSDPAHRFTEHVLSPEAGARVYLATDGVLDLAGGPKGFGFGTERLRALVASLAAVPVGEQAARIAAALAAWAGDHPQRDDLTLLGFEIDWRDAPHVRE